VTIPRYRLEKSLDTAGPTPLFRMLVWFVDRADAGQPLTPCEVWLVEDLRAVLALGGACVRLTP
jgi:hypothetical protein